MKFLASALVLLAGASCATKPADSPVVESAPAAGAEIVDLTEFEGQAMSVEQFLKVCQRASGRNFTYTDATRGELEQRKVAFTGAGRMTAAEFDLYFAARMSACGFLTKPIGPEHLRVYLVEPRAS